MSLENELFLERIKKLKPFDFTLWFYIYMYNRHSGLCMQKNKEIANILNKELMWISTTIQRLVKNGFLEVEYITHKKRSIKAI